MPTVSLGSANLGVVAKACSRCPSYSKDLQFEGLAGKLQIWKRMRICVLVKIPAALKGQGMAPSGLKQEIQFQNFSAQDTFERLFKMLVGASAVLWKEQSFKCLANIFYLYLYF